MTIAHTDTVWPPDVLTLSIDIGGSGFKASIVNAQGVMITERVRRAAIGLGMLRRYAPDAVASPMPGKR